MTDEYKDALVTNVSIKFGYLGRLRVLFGRTIHVHIHRPFKEVLEDGSFAEQPEVHTSVERIFPRRSPMGEIHEPEPGPESSSWCECGQINMPGAETCKHCGESLQDSDILPHNAEVK